MDSTGFCNLLARHGFDFATGVPCSILAGILDVLSGSDAIGYVPATREDEALGIATGAYLAGRRPVVLMQNSGLGSAINPLTSLDLLYRIPMLLVISWRGHGRADAPEHRLMGRVTMPLLELVGVPVQEISEADPEAAIAAAVGSLERDTAPAVVILRRGVIA
ncbi:MAG: thiamine pyrophosphate-binding protein [Dehalococcoidales bacterium]